MKNILSIIALVICVGSLGGCCFPPPCGGGGGGGSGIVTMNSPAVQHTAALTVAV